MPELPEVETIVRTFRPRVEGRRIVAFESRWAKQVSPSVAAVRRGLVGRTITRLTRRAKFIVFELDNAAALLVHLRMSGRFEWQDNGARPRHRHIRAIWRFDNGARLLFDDARKFGRIILAAHPADVSAALDGLGPEPLDRRFNAAALHKLLTRRARQLKPLLLDQSVLAGLGNIYADEALHRAGLHPLMRSDLVSFEQSERLHAAIRDVLREGIRRNGTSLDWIYPEGRMQDYLRVYGRTGEPCRRCGCPIVSLRVSQRGTHICPQCQPAP